MASPPFRSITPAAIAASATSTGTGAVTTPSGAAVGDALVFYLLLTTNVQGVWPNSITWPSGSTNLGYIDNGASAYNRLYAAVLPLTTTPAADYAATWASADLFDSICGLVCFEDVDGAVAVDDYDAQVNASSTNIGVPENIATVIETTRVLLLSGSHGAISTTGNAITHPAGFTEHAEHSAANGDYGRVSVCSASVAGTGATGTATATVGTAYGSQTFSILLRPANPLGVGWTEGAGTTLATDDVSGVHHQRQKWTAGADGTADDVSATAPLPVTATATTSGGASAYKLVSATGTNSASIKGSAGLVYGVIVGNTNSSPRYLKLYDRASAPTVGTHTPAMTIPVHRLSKIDIPHGATFASGIGIGLTTGAADNDTGGVAANELAVTVLYK